MIKEAIVKIVNKGDLTYDEAYTVMNEIMSGGRKPDAATPRERRSISVCKALSAGKIMTVPD